MHCICPFCQEPRLPMFMYTDVALEWLAQTTDEHHRVKRVYAFIELYYRVGVCDPVMPYRVWRAIMGDAVPPFDPGGTGAFQRPLRNADGTGPDPYWLWWHQDEPRTAH